MREHLHLSRVPVGAEYDYIRGILIYYEKEDRFGTIMGIIVNFAVVIILVASAVYGLIRYLNGESVSLVTVILAFIFSVLWFLVPIGVIMSKNIIKKTNRFQNIRVCDVMLTDIKTSPKSHFTLAKAVFADGTVSAMKYTADYYIAFRYQYGTLVAIYDVNGELIYTKIIPKFEYGSKPYILAQKWLQ